MGKLVEALEAVEEARGALYAFHRLTGTADRTLQDAVRLLRDAGRDDLAEDVERTLVGRDVLENLWTFQLVEGFDRDYWSAFRGVEQHVRDQLGGLRPHAYHAQLKTDEQSHDIS